MTDADIERVARALHKALTPATTNSDVDPLLYSWEQANQETFRFMARAALNTYKAMEHASHLL